MDRGDNEKRILILAPGHQDYEDRPLRTLRVARDFGACHFATDTPPGSRSARFRRESEEAERATGRGIHPIALPDRGRVFIVNKFWKYLFIVRVVRMTVKLRPDIIHIHEQGRLGLLLAFLIRRFLPGCRMIFDYHDWIPLEVAVFCRKKKALYAVLYPLLLRLYRLYARSVDTFVCVSPGHAEWARTALGAKEALVVENVRDKRAVRGSYDGPLVTQLLFVGHVMRERKIEYAVDRLVEFKNLGMAVDLMVCGKLLDRDYVEELRDYAVRKGVADRIRFTGAYTGDAELEQHMVRGTVGYWNKNYSDFDTGVEKLTSGNKFFTYLSLGIPVLLEDGFDGMIGILRRYQAGESFKTGEDFVAQARRIWETEGLWDAMHRSAYRVTDDMNTETYVPLLRELYR